MTDFEYDCYQKKQIARSARYRKRGSKSKACSLSTDHMTRKEWEKRCGPVITYNFNLPTTWAAFKYWPRNVQIEYIEGVQDKYHASLKDIAKMLGITPDSLDKYCKMTLNRSDLSQPYVMTPLDRAQWNSFLELIPEHQFNGDAPMTYLEFQQLSSELQYRYIRYWQEHYHANSRAISFMLGQSYKSFSHYLRTRLPEIKFPRGVKMTEEQEKAWEDMMYRRNIVEITDEKTLDEDAEDVTEPDVTNEPTSEPDVTLPPSSGEKKFTLSGEFTPEEILNIISTMFGNNRTMKGKFEINCTLY